MESENSYEKTTLLARKNFHELIAIATRELNEDKLDDGSWGLALMEANGNIQEAKGLYIKHRVQILKDDSLLKEIEKQEKLEEKKKKELLRLEQIKKEEEFKNLPIEEKIGFSDPTLAINKLKFNFGIRLAQDLMPLLEITYADGSYKLRDSDAEFKNLQDALIQHICIHGYEKGE